MREAGADSSGIDPLSKFEIRHALQAVRAAIGQPLERWLIGREPLTIISEDAWGGEFCRAAGLPFSKPLAGAFIVSGDYLYFLENIAMPDAFDLEPLAHSSAYPIGRTPYATIHFLHATSWEAAAAAFQRRAARINRDRLFFKIDFGKSGYTQADVDRWNALGLRNSIALVPPGSRLGFDFTHVHQGCRMKKWTYDGAAMFHLSRRVFDFHYWAWTGELRPCWWNRTLNFFFWDRLLPSEIMHLVRMILFGAAEPTPIAYLKKTKVPMSAPSAASPM